MSETPKYIKKSGTPAEQLVNVRDITVAEFRRLVETTKVKLIVDIWVTPEIAAAALEYKLVGDRDVRVERVREYVPDIEGEAWFLTGQGAEFSNEGKRINGQHRFHAVVRAEKFAVPMQIAFGCDPQGFKVADRGLPRRLADAVRIAAPGRTYPKERASILSNMDTLENGTTGYFTRHQGGTDVADALSADMDWWFERVGVGSKNPLATVYVAAPVLYYRPLLDRSVLEKCIAYYVHGHLDGRVETGHPMLWVRHRALAKALGVKGTSNIAKRLRAVEAGVATDALDTVARTSPQRLAMLRVLRCLDHARHGRSVEVVRDAGLLELVKRVCDERASYGLDLRP